MAAAAATAATAGEAAGGGATLRIGDRVQVAAGGTQDGCIKGDEVGQLIEVADDPSDTEPYKVQAANGETWYYEVGQLATATHRMPFEQYKAFRTLLVSRLQSDRLSTLAGMTQGQLLDWYAESTGRPHERRLAALVLSRMRRREGVLQSTHEPDTDVGETEDDRQLVLAPAAAAAAGADISRRDRVRSAAGSRAGSSAGSSGTGKRTATNVTAEGDAQTGRAAQRPRRNSLGVQRYVAGPATRTAGTIYDSGGAARPGADGGACSDAARAPGADTTDDGQGQTLDSTVPLGAAVPTRKVPTKQAQAADSVSLPSDGTALRAVAAPAMEHGAAEVVHGRRRRRSAPVVRYVAGPATATAGTPYDTSTMVTEAAQPDSKPRQPPQPGAPECSPPHKKKRAGAAAAAAGRSRSAMERVDCDMCEKECMEHHFAFDHHDLCPPCHEAGDAGTEFVEVDHRNQTAATSEQRATTARSQR